MIRFFSPNWLKNDLTIAAAVYPLAGKIHAAIVEKKSGEAARFHLERAAVFSFDEAAIDKTKEIWQEIARCLAPKLGAESATIFLFPPDACLDGGRANLGGQTREKRRRSAYWHIDDGALAAGKDLWADYIDLPDSQADRPRGEALPCRIAAITAAEGEAAIARLEAVGLNCVSLTVLSEEEKAAARRLLSLLAPKGNSAPEDRPAAPEIRDFADDGSVTGADWTFPLAAAVIAARDFLAAENPLCPKTAYNFLPPKRQRESWAWRRLSFLSLAAVLSLIAALYFATLKDIGREREKCQAQETALHFSPVAEETVTRLKTAEKEIQTKERLAALLSRRRQTAAPTLEAMGQLLAPGLYLIGLTAHADDRLEIIIRAKSYERLDDFLVRFAERLDTLGAPPLQKKAALIADGWIEFIITIGSDSDAELRPDRP